MIPKKFCHLPGLSCPKSGRPSRRDADVSVENLLVETLREGFCMGGNARKKGEIMKMWKRRSMVAVFCMTLAGLLCLTGCGGGTTATDPAEASAASDPSPDRAILVVSFGTSYNDSRDLTIGGIENAIEDAFPEYQVYRAFTSQIIIDKLKERDGIEIDNVEEALNRAADDGIRTLIVQPTHLMSGYEYEDLKTAVEAQQDQFASVALGEPLLTDDQDYEDVAAAISEKTQAYLDQGDTAVCFMGHGTEAASNVDYARLQEVLTNDGYTDRYVGTVEAEPSVDDLIETVRADSKYKKVVLLPLMVVAGDHANNDMAGDDPDSWKSRFAEAGYDVECVLEGLGQDPAIQKIYVEHTRNAIDSMQ